MADNFLTFAIDIAADMHGVVICCIECNATAFVAAASPTARLILL
jgi:hypothetical protein